MTISESIARYTIYKNGHGVLFDSGKRYLVSLTRCIGDADLRFVKVEDVVAHLDNSSGRNSTWRLKYGVFVSFFDFWASRGEMPYLLFPPPKPRDRQRSLPYIYTKEQLKILFGAVDVGRKTHTVIDRATMRTLMLLLYGTGALLGEAMSLNVEDVDLKHHKIVFNNRILTRCRQIPICDDLCIVLLRYMAWRVKNNLRNARFFVTKADRPLSMGSVEKTFCRIRKSANIWRESSATYQPRLQDLKSTFAVHRITSWIRSGADLNRMLPALATYMGQRFGSTDRYFQLAPERFKKQLKKLSPQGHSGHWRNDRKLMDFLDSL
jgi:integrase/recombinase XerD